MTAADPGRGTRAPRRPRRAARRAQPTPRRAEFGTVGLRGRASTSTGSRCCTTRVQDARRRVGRATGGGCCRRCSPGSSRSTSPSPSSSSRCPRVAHEFHTSITVLTWTMIGPLLAYGLAAPLFGKVGDVFGHRRLYLVGLLGAMVSAAADRRRPDRGHPDPRPHARRRAGRGDRHGVDGADHVVVPRRGAGEGDGVVVARGRGRAGPRRLARLADHPVLRVARRCSGSSSCCSSSPSASSSSSCRDAARRRGGPSDRAPARCGRSSTMDWVGSWSLSLAVTAAHARAVARPRDRVG